VARACIDDRPSSGEQQMTNPTRAARRARPARLLFTLLLGCSATLALAQAPAPTKKPVVRVITGANVANLEGGAPIMNAVIATLGLNMALHSVAGMIWGNQTNVFTSPVADLPVFKLFGVNVSPDSALTILVSVAMVVIFTLILRHTRAGVALRAASQNQQVAKLMGISVSRSFALAWAMGSMAGVVAGMLVAPVLFLDVNMMGPLLIKGFAGAVLGGLGSLGGVFVGGLMLGVIENLMGAYVSGSFGEALSFLLIIVVLIVAPAGIFGRVKSQKF